MARSLTGEALHFRSDTLLLQGPTIKFTGSAFVARGNEELVDPSSFNAVRDPPEGLFKCRVRVGNVQFIAGGNTADHGSREHLK